MATTLTVNASINWDAIAGKTTATGNDTYNISAAAVLTMDTDTRVCNNPCVDFGPINIDATTGGQWAIDGTKVRLIPFNTGSGTVPAIGTSITQGGVAAYFLGVWTSIGQPPLNFGDSLSGLSGFIKVKNKTGGNYAAGALGGIGATATGADVVGWIHILGRSGSAFTCPYIGSLTVVGDWLEVGVTNNTRNQQVQLPWLSGNAVFSGVWIETSAGSGTYEHYPNAIQLIAATTPTSKARGQFVWINASGVCRIGHDGTNAVGYLPPTGCKIRIPNVILDHTNYQYYVNFNYNGTNTNSYTLNNNSGPISISNAVMNWISLGSFLSSFNHVALGNYWSHLGTSSSGFNDIIVAWGPGALSSNYQSYRQFEAYGSISYGMLVADCSDITIFYGTTAKNGIAYLGGKGTWTNIKVIAALGTWSGASGGILQVDSYGGATFVNPTMIGGPLYSLGSSAGIIVKNLKYAQTLAGTSTTTTFNFAANFGGTVGLKISSVLDGLGLLAGETNTQPGDAFVTFTNQGTIDIQNIGLIGTPVDAGSVNPTPLFAKVLSPQSVGPLRIRRCYFANLATGLFQLASILMNSLTVENVAGDYADMLIVGRSRQTQFKGIACALDKTATTGISDNFFHDVFTSTTTGSIALVFNQQLLWSVVSIKAGTPYFSGSGSVYMKTIGDQIEWTMPYYALGHTGFVNTPIVLTGGTASNFSIEFKIDVNDGNGFNATWATLSYANLSAFTIDAAKGFKLKIRITTAVGNTDALTFLEILTTSSPTAQAYQYPLDYFTLTLQNVVAGSRVHIETQGGGTQVMDFVATAGDNVVSMPYDTVTPANNSLRIKVRNASGSPAYQPFETLTTAIVGSASVYVSQQLDQ